MAVQLPLPVPVSRAQLRRLHAIWRQWAGGLHLSRAADTELRHYYIERFTTGRAKTSNELTATDAARVMARLERLARISRVKRDVAAGTAGRHGYPERSHIPPDAAAWRALWACARELGMDRAELELFIRRHYVGRGLRGVSDIDTMADLNRVLWGLKAMLRRGPHPKRAPKPTAKKAA